jgi:hypothetical protein
LPLAVLVLPLLPAPPAGPSLELGSTARRSTRRPNRRSNPVTTLAHVGLLDGVAGDIDLATVPRSSWRRERRSAR